MIFFFGGGSILRDDVSCSTPAGLDVPGEAATPKAAEMSDEIFLSHLPGLNKSELPGFGVN